MLRASMDVLLVEDHEEVRGALTELLQGEGFVVTAVGSAEDALAAARGRTFGLLVTDYNLPGNSGADLVLELRRRGTTLPTLMITAGTKLPDVPGVRTLTKPMDLDVFVASVHALVAGVERRPERSRMAAAPGPPPAKLRFYVSSRTAPSIRASARLAAVLARFQSDDFVLEIFDFAQGVPPEADADKVLGTPALLVELPDGRRTWWVGDLKSTESLELVLETGGVRRRGQG